MTISIPILILILLTHFLADFGLQTHDQATLKSISNRFLFYHVATYSFIWLIVAWCMFGNIMIALEFSLFTFFCHFATDWITSRISKPFFSKQDYHNGFVVIGADQLLHYIQLIFTFWVLS